MAYLRIREWDKLQHYKDRDPPWIKLHRNLLTSQTWVSLDDASRVLAVALMVLAAGTGNRVPADREYLKRVAYLNSDPDWTVLVRVQFVDLIDEDGSMLAPASTPLAKRTKCSSEERRGETEENRGETDRASALDPPEDGGRDRKVSKRRTPKKPEVPLPEDFHPDTDPELEQYALDHLPDADVAAMATKFRLQAETKQWRYASWPLAWKTYCRNARVDSGHWAAGQYPRKRPNGSVSGRYRSADQIEDEVIERAIAEGLSDEQIAALPDLELAPNVRTRIRDKRRVMVAPC